MSEMTAQWAKFAFPALSVTFTIATLFRLWKLRRETTKIVHDGKILSLKKILAAVVAAAQAVRTVMRSSESNRLSGEPGIWTDAIHLLASLIACWLSKSEHRYALRPSTLLTLFLLAGIVLDLYPLMTYFAAREITHFSVLLLHACSSAALLLVECRSKKAVLKGQYANIPPEALAGSLDRMLFGWMTAMVFALRESLFENVPPMPDDFSPQLLRRQMLHAWQRKVQGSYLLPRTLFGCLQRPFLAIIPCRLCLIAFRYAQPVLMSHVIKTVATAGYPDKSTSSAATIVTFAVVVYMGLTMSNSAYYHQLDQLKIKIKICLVSLLHEKLLRLRQSTNTSDDGKAITLVSTDVESLVGTAEMVHETWAQILEVAIGMWLLTRKIGWLSPVLLISIYGCSRMSRYVALHLKNHQKSWNNATQARLAMTGTLLNAMKGIKMTGTSRFFKEKILLLRSEEIAESLRQRWVMVAANASANALGLFSPAVVLTGFALNHYYKERQALDTDTAFATVAVLTMVTHPANMVMTIIPRAIACMASFERTEDFLLQPSQRKYRETLRGAVALKAAPAISLRALNVGFPAQQVLEDVHLDVASGSITVCLGPVGSGKTSLIRIIAGDLEPSAGKVIVTSDEIALGEQVPWLPAGTLQDVICSPSRKFDSEWYMAVIVACCLDTDINTFPDRDKTQIGSRGVNLSGGQRLRVALARAVYSRKSIILLDDPFSALDGDTEARIVNNLFGHSGLCRKLRTTVVLTTNSITACASADYVVVLGNHRIRAQGHWHDIRPTLDSFQSIKSSVTVVAHDNASRDLCQDLALKDATADSDHAAGSLDVYRYYLKATGLLEILILVGCTTSYAIFVTLPQCWLKWWTESKARWTWFYAIGYLTIALLAWISTNGTMYSTHIRIAPTSGRNLHAALLSNVLGAQLAYFFDTETGQILNRFSQDIQVVDRELPSGLSTLSNQIFKLCMQALALVYVHLIMAITLPFCAVVTYLIQRRYLKASRRLRYLDLQLRARIVTSFTETTEGLASIRAFGWQEEYAALNNSNLDDSQRPHYYLLCLQRWLNVILDVIVACIAIFAIIIAVCVQNDGDGAKIGITLNVVLVANTTLLRLVESWTSLEISAGAIARLESLERTVPQELDAVVLRSQNKSWPSAGKLSLTNLQVSYNSRSTALRRVSIEISPGQKVLLCGRTGSGKSTLILALLRLLLPDEGDIQVDDVSLSGVSLASIREQCFITVPQDAFVLSDASLRDNVDLLGKYSDEQVEAVLTLTKLWSEHFARHQSVEAMAPNSKSTCKNTILSQSLRDFPPLTSGQLQLLSLARAILRARPSARGATTMVPHPKPILLLDEVTSSIDPHTEQVVHDLIQNEFSNRGHTVIMIAHRVGLEAGGRGMHTFDRTIWLDSGQVVKDEGGN